MALFGPKPNTASIRRFEFHESQRTMKTEMRTANALEHIAYSLGRIEMLLTEKWGEPGAATPAGEEPKARE
jgi:hypothetical protein